MDLGAWAVIFLVLFFSFGISSAVKEIDENARKDERNKK